MARAPAVDFVVLPGEAPWPGLGSGRRPAQLPPRLPPQALAPAPQAGQQLPLTVPRPAAAHLQQQVDKMLQLATRQGPGLPQTSASDRHPRRQGEALSHYQQGPRPTHADRPEISKGPIRGDGPFIGQCFRSNNYRAKHQLGVLVTPRTIHNTEGGNSGYQPGSGAPRRFLAGR